MYQRKLSIFSILLVLNAYSDEKAGLVIINQVLALMYKCLYIGQYRRPDKVNSTRDTKALEEINRLHIQAGRAKHGIYRSEKIPGCIDEYSTQYENLKKYLTRVMKRDLHCLLEEQKEYLNSIVSTWNSSLLSEAIETNRLDDIHFELTESTTQ